MLTVLELIGGFSFAVSGALLAVRRGFDVVGILLLALITAIGGGVVRDLLIGTTPPEVFTDWPYFTAALVGALVTFVYHPVVERLENPLLISDAAGLGFFLVVGTVKALDHGLSPLPAAAVGVTTGVGGGVLRDVIARETPVLVRPDSELYALPAIVGALVIALLWSLQAYRPVLGMGVAAAIVGIRLLALAHGWRAPTALAGRRIRPGSGRPPDAGSR